MPPEKIVTGLGGGVDDLVHSGYSIQWRTRDVDRKGWKIQYGNSSSVDVLNKVMTVLSGQSVSYTTSHFSHEVGHATSSFREDLASRDAYIRSRCTDEGFALGVNIVARKEIKHCAGVDTGVVSADVPYFTDWFASMANNPPVLYGDFGYAFCERNIESVSGKNYLDYYGDWYDAHYMASVPEASGFATDPFFDKLEMMAGQARRGIDYLQDVWPGAETLVRSKTFSRSFVGGSSAFVPGVTVVDSEIRMTSLDTSKLLLATMNVEGRCISLESVRARYPSAIMIDSPTTGDPDDKGSWSVFGPWGQLGFGFAYKNPKCVASVTFNPNESAPDWAADAL